MALVTNLVHVVGGNVVRSYANGQRSATTPFLLSCRAGWANAECRLMIGTTFGTVLVIDSFVPAFVNQAPRNRQLHHLKMTK